MKLLTHNFLACNVKGVKNGYPLKIEATQVEVREAEMDPGECQPGPCGQPVDAV
jgi:multifunctional methyltransferase subunit TRM112